MTPSGKQGSVLDERGAQTFAEAKLVVTAALTVGLT